MVAPSHMWRCTFKLVKFLKKLKFNVSIAFTTFLVLGCRWLSASVVDSTDVEHILCYCDFSFFYFLFQHMTKTQFTSFSFFLNLVFIVFFPLPFSPLILPSPQQSPHCCLCPQILFPFCSVLKLKINITALAGVA